MGLGTNHLISTEVASFIPELWSDEIIATFKANLVMAPLVHRMDHNGKKGDRIHVPKPSRGAASSKGTEAQVTLIANSDAELAIDIDQHWEYSRLLEDFADKQAIGSLRAFLTDDAGYALATKVDSLLIQLGRYVQGGAGTAAYTTGYIGSNGTTAYVAGSNNEASLTDAAIRRSIQRLNDQNVPLTNRHFVVPPTCLNDMLGIARFTEAAFRGEGESLKTGVIGRIYGVDVLISTNCDTTSGSNSARVALLFQKDAFVLAEQMSVRAQVQYKQEYLGTLFTSDMIFGVKEMRDESAVALIVPA